MKKYIDADCLRAEIDKHQNDVNEISQKHGGKNSFRMGRQMEIDLFRRFIDSLQQEQPTPSCKSCGFYENNCPFIRGTFKPYPNKVCKDYTYSVMKEQEQPEVDLEKFDKEVTKIWGRYAAEPNDSIACLHIETFVEVARHFYELGLKAKEGKK